MGSSTVATFLILTMLFAILSSLGFALFHLLREEHDSQKTAKALSVRVGLSLSLFLGLLFAIQMGWIIPNPIPL